MLTFRTGERGEDADVDRPAARREAVERYVERLALSKAQAGTRRVLWHVLPRPVLSADTTLEVDGEIVGKPRDAAEAQAILERLSGRRHPRADRDRDERRRAHAQQAVGQRGSPSAD